MVWVRQVRYNVWEMDNSMTHDYTNLYWEVMLYFPLDLTKKQTPFSKEGHFSVFFW